MKKKEIIANLEYIFEHNSALSDSDRKTIQEAISIVKKEQWYEAAKLLAAILGIAEKLT